MKPSQLSSQLRRIASAIDNSKNPSRKLVARDLKKVLVSIDSGWNPNTDTLDPNRMVIAFYGPDWSVEEWKQIHENWEKLKKAFDDAGAYVDDKGYIILDLEPKNETKVRSVIEDAKVGKYGLDIQTYWNQAEETYLSI